MRDQQNQQESNNEIIKRVAMIALLSGIYLLAYVLFFQSLDEQSYILTHRGFYTLLAMPIFTFSLATIGGMLVQSWAAIHLSLKVRSFCKGFALLSMGCSFLFMGTLFFVDLPITIQTTSAYFVPFLFVGILFSIGIYKE